ncbi:TPA: recombinase family protein [Streptococcus suis]|nr:recombinase family protein [Streptococcus suis]
MKTVTQIKTLTPSLTTKLKVATYTRISHSSLKHSLSNQVSYYNQLIQSNPSWSFAGIYIDDSISGKTQENRSDFQALIKACCEGKVDLILTKSISRFGRNTVELLTTVRELKELGVNVRFEKEGIETLTSDGELLLTLLASVAQEESKSISENIKWHVKKSFEQGLPYIPQDIFGYRWQGDTYVIEPREAEIVKQVFQWYMDGLGVPTIAKLLNERGERTRLGNEFNKSILYEFFKQEAYFGRLVLQKTYRTDFSGNPKRNHGQKDKYIVDNAHEPIVSKEYFESVLAEKRRRSKGRYYRDESIPTLFRDKIYCAHCGVDMLLTVDKPHTDKATVRFNCRTRQHKGLDACPSKTLAEKRLIMTLSNYYRYSIDEEWVAKVKSVTFNSIDYSITVTFENGEIQTLPLKKGQFK